MATSTGVATMQNWLDPSSIWVVINPQTGVVATTPVLAIDPTYTDPSGNTTTIIDSSKTDVQQRGTWIMYSCGIVGGLQVSGQGQALGGK